jgi:hypothetical protein
MRTRMAGSNSCSCRAVMPREHRRTALAESEHERVAP